MKAFESFKAAGGLFLSKFFLDIDATTGSVSCFSLVSKPRIASPSAVSYSASESTMASRSSPTIPGLSINFVTCVVLPEQGGPTRRITFALVKSLWPFEWRNSVSSEALSSCPSEKSPIDELFFTRPSLRLLLLRGFSASLSIDSPTVVHSRVPSRVSNIP
uniref:Uncharacterized protein TCIL3000_6_2710 n=1 Tax=Trypanosoma congolense (strain IL3000) TaxID=1068625 RepID=G0UNR7_TRYCI|nr:unnamed protein product [Trypanosoma congolense IL3000]